MPVDYSKWDNLELSDDSDIEVHPNVDKRSFIRAKQAQIHQDRAQRKHHIETLKYERIINDGLLLRINRLLTALKSHKPDAAARADELVLQSLIESAGDPSDDQPPAPPAGVHSQTEEQPRYSKMMASLVDQVKHEVDEKKGENRLESFITGITEHKDKVDGLQKELNAKLQELEKEQAKHITSDDLKEGFSASHVSKHQADTSPAGGKSTEVELLNPKSAAGDISSGAEADVEDTKTDDPDSIVASPAAKHFAKIAYGDYRASLQFVQQNPSILTEKDSDGLLVEAFNAQLDGKDVYARQCVHQALLIQYCRQLGKDGVGLFFKRITTKDHNASKLFIEDVQGTYQKIRVRAKELQKQREEEGEGGVEQIQLHAVDPNTTINIRVPPPIPTDLTATSTNPPPTEDEIVGRRIFDSFPPGLQRALETGSLDEINKVLGKMSVDEAEEIVGQLSEGGILSVEEGVIDATNEEGQKIVDEISRTGHLPASELSEDPPMD
ncbi:Hsp90 co-chaperone Cdc37 [Microthyrium microscopicum]|uniref:Hsp90 chaperone protein kinase-targeting subunit n=1 Tax=Microthyrium microscopicum TaxID=703497 RepID=A0A6A6UMV8_9PEZI|nr:Hsp90 co-chaperone Cdc37 [Microthyrium microscopicum]